MKYQVALKEKNVKKEDLSKKLQLKIDALDKLVERLKIATDDEAEKYQEAVAEMDDQITKEVKKFNLEVHKRRLESIAKLNVAKKSTPAKVEVEAEAEPEEEMTDSLELVKEEVAPVKVNTEKLQENLADLREVAMQSEELRLYQERYKEYQQAQQFQDPEPEEIQDFQKDEKVKPKKGKSLSFGLIGIGIFFLTWGAVNLARQK